MKRFNLSARLFSDAFWSGVLNDTDELTEERERLGRELRAL